MFQLKLSRVKSNLLCIRLDGWNELFSVQNNWSSYMIYKKLNLSAFYVRYAVNKHIALFLFQKWNGTFPKNHLIELKFCLVYRITENHMMKCVCVCVCGFEYSFQQKTYTRSPQFDLCGLNYNIFILFHKIMEGENLHVKSMNITLNFRTRHENPLFENILPECTNRSGECPFCRVSSYRIILNL